MMENCKKIREGHNMWVWLQMTTERAIVSVPQSKNIQGNRNMVLPQDSPFLSPEGVSFRQEILMSQSERQPGEAERLTLGGARGTVRLTTQPATPLPSDHHPVLLPCLSGAWHPGTPSREMLEAPTARAPCPVKTEKDSCCFN